MADPRPDLPPLPRKTRATIIELLRCVEGYYYQDRIICRARALAAMDRADRWLEENPPPKDAPPARPRMEQVDAWPPRKT